MASLIFTDVLIVGQGLAGSCLAFELYKQNCSFILLDNDNPNTSTKVAAGIVNPLVFRRLTKSWNVDELLPSAENFYESFQEVVGKQCYFHKKIIRVFENILEQNMWLEKSDLDGFKNHIGSIYTRREAESNWPISAPYGAGEVKSSGYLDTTTFLAETRQLFIKSETLKTAQFDYNKLRQKDNGTVVYTDGREEIQAKNIVFCEGFKAIDNPFFPNLPFKLAKGEVIELENTDKIELKEILNKNGFIHKQPDGNFKAGATYEWNDLSPSVTKEAKEEIIQKIGFFNYREQLPIIKQKAAVRPTVTDRRPLLARHNKYSNLYLFNGLGTKGVLIAPYYAKQLVSYVLNDQPLDNDVDLARFRLKTDG